jgi:hypothetical protein
VEEVSRLSKREGERDIYIASVQPLEADEMNYRLHQPLVAGQMQYIHICRLGFCEAPTLWFGCCEARLLLTQHFGWCIGPECTGSCACAGLWARM